MERRNKAVINKTLPLKIMLVVILVISPVFHSCDEDGNFFIPLTESEIIEGLKEALKVGATNSVVETNRTDGYYGNPLIRIPWPEDAMGAYTYINNNLPQISHLLDEVVVLMNRGAEEASAKAKPIFIDAVTSMTIQDARDILNGTDNAATNYLHDRTYSSLREAFRPDIHNALESVGAATAWSEITGVYNPVAGFIPGINPINTDLADYTTAKALDGLFLLLEEEEYKIRTDPAARINEILRRVFGTLDD